MLHTALKQMVLEKKKRFLPYAGMEAILVM